jgi:hypothetical protein
MSDHKYKLTYRIKGYPNGLTKDELGPLAKSSQGEDGFGACDAMLMASIIYPEDGSLSILFVGHDGRTNTELSDDEWFKVWSMLSGRLADSKTLGPGRRALCQSVIETLRETMLAARTKGT